MEFLRFGFVTRAALLCASASICSVNPSSQARIESVAPGDDDFKQSPESLYDEFMSIGDQLRNLNDYVEAEANYRRALAVAERNLPAMDSHRMHALYRIAICLAIRGEYDKAAPIVHEVIALIEAEFGRDDHHLAGPLNLLSVIYVDQGNLEETERVVRRAIKVGETAPDATSRKLLINNFHNLGMVLRRAKKYEEAEQFCRKALDLYSVRDDGDDASLGEYMASLGGICSLRGKAVEAEELIRRGIAKIEGSPSKTGIHCARGELANLLCDSGRMEEGLALYKQVWDGSRSVYGPSHPRLARVGEYYASYLRKAGRDEEAKAIEAAMPKRKTPPAPASDTTPKK